MPKKVATKAAQADEQQQWAILLPDSVVRDLALEDGLQPSFIKLCHPKTGKGKQFLLTRDERSVFEVLKFNEEPRSWFIEDSVQRDGSLLITTPIDPLFLILPYLTKFSQKPLDQILLDDQFPKISQLSSCLDQEELLNVCDMKGDDDLRVFRISEEKVLSWLNAKVDSTASKLSSVGVYVKKGAQSANFIRSKRNAEVATQDDYIRYAFGLISDYVSSSWSEKLKEKLNIPEETISPSLEEPPHKRAKTGADIPEALEDYSKEFNKLKNNRLDSGKPTVKLTAAQKSLSKVDKKGMKSLASFFGPGAKKSSKK